MAAARAGTALTMVGLSLERLCRAVSHTWNCWKVLQVLGLILSL